MKKTGSILICICLMFSCLFPASTAFAATQATYHVSLTGSDSNQGTESQPFLTLEKARDTVRTINSNMTGDIIIYVHGGTYNLTQPLQFDQSDSGNNGYNVIYKSYQGEIPIISGGQSITGWTQYSGSIWRAYAGTTINFRQLYVNGVRAIRARSESGLSGAVLTTDGNGYTTTDTSMISWENQSNIEFIYNCIWIQTRCLVSSITQDGTNAKINMLQPYFSYARNKHPTVFAEYPTYIENALELLDSSGEWYLDHTSGYLYYMPRDGEDMTAVNVVAPVLEKLVEVKGSLTTPVRNIQFEGITFSYGSYLATSQIGHNDIQANMLLVDNNYSPLEAVHIPSNVIVDAAENIKFERCEFSHLGSNGLDIQNGSDSNTVNGCKFYDISGSGIQVLGFVNDPHPADARKICNNNNITNNFVHDVAVEYAGAVGIFAGYTDNTRIANNEVCNLPYSGISVGWGWGAVDSTPTPSNNNLILNNHVYNHMNSLWDGGAIYSLGAQPGEIISGNVIHHQNGEHGSLYLDDGSRYVTAVNNAIYTNVRNVTVRGSDHNIQYNYWDFSNDEWQQTNSIVANNTLITGFDQVPSFIFNNAGIQPAYADIAPEQKFIELALSKTASASSVYDTLHAAGNAVDGRSHTGWSPAATDVSPWLQIDLGSSYQLGALELTSWHPDYGYAEVFRKNFEVYASNSSDFSTYTVLGGRGEAAYPQGQWNLKINDKNSYRYIRIAKTADEYFYISDLKVWRDMGTNFAVGASITSDSQWTDHSPSRAADGKWIDGVFDKWSSDCLTSTHWLRMDLGTARTVSRFVVKHEGSISYDLFGTIYNTSDFKIQGSDDGNSWNDLVIVTGNTQNETVHDITPVTYRFFRLYITDSGIDNYARIAEFEIRGSSISSENVALNKTTSASSNYDTYYNAAKANDGSTSTGWSPTGTDVRPWWQADLGNEYHISSIELTTRQDLEQLPTRRNFEVRASNTSDFSTYTVLGRCEGTAIPDKGMWMLDVTSIQKYRYIRVVKTVDEYFFIAEMKVFGNQ